MQIAWVLYIRYPSLFYEFALEFLELLFSESSIESGLSFTFYYIFWKLLDFLNPLCNIKKSMSYVMFCMIFYRLSSFLQFLDSHGYFLLHLYFSHNAHKNMRFIWENDIFASQILHKIAVLHEISLSFQFLENDALKKYLMTICHEKKKNFVYFHEKIFILFASWI